MNSRLSSLLVRDGVLGVKRMEQAFQRQVIYGGALDTILFEMGAVPEERLWHYLSLATGLPAADKDLLEYFDPRAVQVCPRAQAERYHVAPVALDGPALRVLVTDPVDLGELESLATAQGVPVQPFVVPEFRFHVHLERLFGIPTPSRFAALARKSSFVPSVRPAEPSVVVDEQMAAPEPAQPRDTTPMAAVSSIGSEAATPPQGVRPPERRTVAFSTDALQKELAAEEAKRRAAASAAGLPESGAQVTTPMVTPAPAGGVAVRADAAAPGDGGALDGMAPLALAAARGSVRVPAASPAPAYVEDKVIADPSLFAASPAPREPGPSDGAVQAPWRGGSTIEPRELEPRDARTQMATADDRDAIFGLLVRAARARTWYAAVLTVQGATAFGRMAIEGDKLDQDIGQVAVPLASAPALRGAFESRSPYIGPVRSNVPEIDLMLEQMGGVIPPAALVVPVVIRDRTVALLYAHRGGDALSVSEVADVLPVANDAALALSRLIVKAKAAGYRKPEAQEPPGGARAARPATAPAPIDKSALAELPAKAGEARKNDGGGWGRAAPSQSQTAPAPHLDFAAPAAGAEKPGPTNAPPDAQVAPRLAGTSVSGGGSAGAGVGPGATATASPTATAATSSPSLAPPPIHFIVDTLEAGVEPAATRASEDALARLDDLLPEITRRFPGNLVVDRYATSGRTLRASQHGALLALCVKVGARVVPILVEKLSSADREIRYYATQALAEVRAPIAVAGLVARVFDSDYGVRGAALEALMGYPPRDVDAALEPVRRALRSDSLRARAAAYALGELRDVKSILDLIDATERDPTTAAEAHRALVLITKQDFGTKAKKWRKWWEQNRDRSRIEWMLDSLGHPEDAVRLSASEELKRLTGEYFGYHHDAPKREREEARQRWLKWWEETGRKRFLR
jgi:hypothetical protein